MSPPFSVLIRLDKVVSTDSGRKRIFQAADFASVREHGFPCLHHFVVTNVLWQSGFDGEPKDQAIADSNLNKLA